MQTSETQIQVNIISKKNDDEINSFDIDLPKEVDALADLDGFFKNKKVLDEFKKLTSKYVKEEKPVEKKSLLIGSHGPSFPAPHGGIPTGGPFGGGVGVFNPIGGSHDVDPFGGGNLIGPNSSIFNNPTHFGGQNPHGPSNPDDGLNFNPGPYGMGAPPDNDDIPSFPGFKKGGPPGGGPPGGFGGGFGGSGGTSGGNFYM